MLLTLIEDSGEAEMADEARGMSPAVFPWNTTVTLADVDARERAERRRIRDQRAAALKARAERASHTNRAPYAGRDDAA